MSLEDVLLGMSTTGPLWHDVERLRSAQRRRVKHQGITNREVEDRLSELEADVGFVTLVLAALLARLDEQGTVNQDDVRSLIRELDDVDGVKDGRLDVGVLRDVTGDD